VHFALTADELAFRDEVRDYLNTLLAPGGDFAHVRGVGGPGGEHLAVAQRQDFERRLGADGWTCVGWPTEFGGRGLPLPLQVLFLEEYARAGGPGRVGHIGEGLLGPTVIAFGTAEQQQRFLEPIRLGTELWCQGYSEPNAGSDLANVSTRAELHDGAWHITGQKVWTSLAQWADWCFVVARTEPGSQRHRGLSYLLVDMRQPGIEVRPIRQLTGSSEFNEVFFDGALAPADHVVGAPGDGWKVAMGTLAFERGASTLGQQLGFTREFAEALTDARRRRTLDDPRVRQRYAAMWARLEIMRWNALRMLTTAHDPALSGPAFIHKLVWARLHRDLGELALDTLGADAMLTVGQPNEHDDGLTPAARRFLFTRADTIYGGSDEIQRNVIGERALGLPR